MAETSVSGGTNSFSSEICRWGSSESLVSWWVSDGMVGVEEKWEIFGGETRVEETEKVGFVRKKSWVWKNGEWEMGIDNLGR